MRWKGLVVPAAKERPFAAALCSGHARIAQSSQVTNLEELRTFYREGGGRRSYVPRRTSAMETERDTNGRRLTDLFF
jgi:hypothetical protein